jgi:hypothetical protein
MKAHSEVTALAPWEVAETVDSVVCALYPRAENPWTEAFLDCDAAGNSVDPYDDFLAAWDRVEHPLPEGRFERAERLAETFPLRSTRHSKARDARYRSLVSLAYWLSRLSEPEPFFLPVRKVGENSMDGSRLIARAVQEGLLIPVKEAIGRQAACFTFNAERVELREGADGSPGRAAVLSRLRPPAV